MKRNPPRKDSESEQPPRTWFVVTLTCVSAALVLAMWSARPRTSPVSQDEALVMSERGVSSPAEHRQPVPGGSVLRPKSVPRNSNKEMVLHASQSATKPLGTEPRMALADRWGIETSSVRLSAGGRALDIRYRVVDPKKAAMLPGSKEPIYLVDQVTGAKVAIPGLPKRQASRMAPGRTYFMLAANTGQVLKPGTQVSLVMGNAQAKDITLQ